MPTIAARPVRCAAIPPKRIGQTRACCSSVRVAITASMLIWSVRAILPWERCWPGKTGPVRVCCRYALMCRTMKPKRHGGSAMPSCGGA